MWCAPQASSCPKTNWWSLLREKKCEREESIPHGLVIPDELCTLIDTKDKGAVTGSAPTRRSVCDCMDFPLHATREGTAKRKMLPVLGVCSPTGSLAIRSGLTRKRVQLRMRCSWSTPFACEAMLSGALCIRMRAASFGCAEHHKAPFPCSSPILSDRSKELPHGEHNAAIEMILHPLHKRTSPPLTHEQAPTA